VISTSNVGSELTSSRGGRIRTWVKYGMAIPQVAALYDVEADEITRILRSPSRG
jgi:hypothetical protein